MSGPPHGSASTYGNHGCRCPECREAWRVYEPARKAHAKYNRARHRPRAEYLASVRKGHGIRSRYVKGCRCPDCRAAEASYRAEYRARQRQNQ